MIDSRSTRAYKLEKENRELKKEIEVLRSGNDITKIINDNVVFLRYQREQQEEIERLNNIINKLERYINEEYIYDELGMKIFDASTLQDKLQELKGAESNE